MKLLIPLAVSPVSQVKPCRCKAYGRNLSGKVAGGIAKGILLFLVIVLLYSCRPVQYVQQESRMQITGKRIKITPIGKPEPISDTVIFVKMIRRQ